MSVEIQEWRLQQDGRKAFPSSQTPFHLWSPLLEACVWFICDKDTYVGDRCLGSAFIEGSLRAESCVWRAACHLRKEKEKSDLEVVASTHPKSGSTCICERVVRAFPQVELGRRGLKNVLWRSLQEINPITQSSTQAKKAEMTWSYRFPNNLYKQKRMISANIPGCQRRKNCISSHQYICMERSHMGSKITSSHHGKFYFDLCLSLLQNCACTFTIRKATSRDVSSRIVSENGENWHKGGRPKFLITPPPPTLCYDGSEDGQMMPKTETNK
ncbi:uncharacterized protein [Eschrichtius robustus]|uniref:uncharacterized protein n=1 Tax=Eschrichtius robustus TaxID=9764 RepID=UPI0035C23EA3